MVRRKIETYVQVADITYSGIALQCGVHKCPSRCHYLADHSKMKCEVICRDLCPVKHKLSWRCFQPRPACRKCETELKAIAKKAQQDHDLELERESKLQAYAKQLAEVQDRIAAQGRLLKHERDEHERQTFLKQQEEELASTIAAIGRVRMVPDASPAPITQLDLADNIVPLASNSAAVPVSAVSQESPGSPIIQADTAVSPQLPSQALSSKPSKAKDDWEWQKRVQGTFDPSLDHLMSMIGLENIKEQFLSIKAEVDVVVGQGVSLKDKRLGATLLGNPGTGKTTVARLYAKFLTTMEVLPGSFFVETTGAALANAGVAGCKKHIEEILNSGGGALFLDEVYQLVSGNSYGGGAVLDYLLTEIENLRGKVVFILAGYNKEMEKFFEHNPGIPSRLSIRLQFQDYDDSELLQIFEYKLEKKWKGMMKVECGTGGLFARIVARRIGRGRDHNGFGNARAVENVVDIISSRQAKRITTDRCNKQKHDNFLLTKIDLLGPEPAKVLAKNAAWTNLKGMTGLASVKQSVQVLLDRVQANYDRELAEKPLVECSLNKVFLGSPGTGKTSVAKLYGQILKDIGLLSNGEGTS